MILFTDTFFFSYICIKILSIGFSISIFYPRIYHMARGVAWLSRNSIRSTRLPLKFEENEITMIMISFHFSRIDRRIWMDHGCLATDSMLAGISTSLPHAESLMIHPSFACCAAVGFPPSININYAAYGIPPIHAEADARWWPPNESSSSSVKANFNRNIRCADLCLSASNPIKLVKK